MYSLPTCSRWIFPDVIHLSKNRSRIFDGSPAARAGPRGSFSCAGEAGGAQPEVEVFPVRNPPQKSELQQQHFFCCDFDFGLCFLAVSSVLPDHWQGIRDQWRKDVAWKRDIQPFPNNDVFDTNDDFDNDLDESCGRLLHVDDAHVHSEPCQTASCSVLALVFELQGSSVVSAVGFWDSWVCALCDY